MTPGLYASLYSLLVAAALLGGVAYGYMAWQANGEAERALWKGVGALVVLLLVARGLLWFLRPWPSRPLLGDVLQETARQRADNNERA